MRSARFFLLSLSLLLTLSLSLSLPLSLSLSLSLSLFIIHLERELHRSVERQTYFSAQLKYIILKCGRFIIHANNILSHNFIRYFSILAILGAVQSALHFDFIYVALWLSIVRKLPQRFQLNPSSSQRHLQFHYLISIKRVTSIKLVQRLNEKLLCHHKMHLSRKLPNDIFIHVFFSPLPLSSHFFSSLRRRPLGFCCFFLLLNINSRLLRDSRFTNWWLLHTLHIMVGN